MQGGNEFGDVAELMDNLRAQMGAIADIEQQIVQLTASAAVHDERIVVTVNAEGHLIDIHFSEKVNSLSYTEVGAGVLAAAQAAAVDVRQQAEALLAPMREERARVPALHEMIAGLPDLQAEMPVPPPVPTTLPDHADGVIVAHTAGAASLIAPEDDETVEDLVFDDVEEQGPSGAGDNASQVTDAGWG